MRRDYVDAVLIFLGGLCVAVGLVLGTTSRLIWAAVLIIFGLGMLLSARGRAKRR